MNYAVLVATRNRPKTLFDLLESIGYQNPVPKQIIVISSGQDISHVPRNFQQLPITHIHLEESGQIKQKMKGVSLVEKGIDWVLFIDDDCVLHAEAIANVSSLIQNKDDIDNIKGIGMRLIEPGEQLKSRQNANWISNLGKVSSSGKAFSYMHSEKSLETFWLNGTSLWRADSLFYYNFPSTRSRYAYAEDLIFSYSVAKTGKLFYFRDAICYMQLPSSYNQKSFEVLQAVLFWRYYFVANNIELSKVRMYLDLIKISLIYLLRNPCNGFRQLREILKSLTIILRAILFKVSPRKILEEVDWLRV